MELRQYWAILTRRWQLIALITVLTFVVSAVMLLFGPKSFKSEMRFAVSVKPEQKVGEYYTYDKYYTWLSSEYLVDDFGEVVKSDSFTSQVSDRLKQRISKEQLKRETTTKKTHRILAVTVTTGNMQDCQEMAAAIRDTMQEQAQTYFKQLNIQDAAVVILDEPTTVPEMGAVRRVLELGLRTLVGFLAGVALAFLLNYLDPSVRSREEAEKMLGLPVLAEIPSA